MRESAERAFRIPDADNASPIPDGVPSPSRTPRTESVASFAPIPQRSAETIRQSPQPNGRNSGARNPPSTASILWSTETIPACPKRKCDSPQTPTEVRRISPPAREKK